MIKVEKDSYGRNIILVPPSQNIAMKRYSGYSEGEASRSDDCQFFLLEELFDEVGGVVLSGELIDYINELKAENAALCERFAALNKMPCNIGDTVYVLFGSCYRCEDYEGDHCLCEKRGKDKIFEMKVGSVRFDKDDYYLYEDPIGISSGLSCSGRNYGKTWFLSMEEAKNHLMKSYDDVIQHA